MMVKTFKKSEWTGAVAALSGGYRVMAPVRSGEVVNFDWLENGATPDFEAKKTRLSPKQALFPQSERMFAYTLKTDDPEAGILKPVPKADSPQAVVGIRPCDAKAITLVARNFDTDEYKDPYWVSRRDNTTLIGLGCNKPGSTCFCTSVGTGPFDQSALDVLVYDLGETMMAKALTQKGEAALSKMGGVDAKAEEQSAGDTLAAEATAKVKANVPSDKLAGLSQTELFDAPFWDEVAAGCLNCGACTYSCPTCWCFDIQDEVKKGEGDRIRNWDACMSPLFTKHASGHNPRDTKSKRVRQRFMHKLKYYVDRYHDGVLCVGCGRCIDACPVNIDIRRVFELMNAYQK
jgi:ferredoxin